MKKLVSISLLLLASSAWATGESHYGQFRYSAADGMQYYVVDLINHENHRDYSQVAQIASQPINLHNMNINPGHTLGGIDVAIEMLEGKEFTVLPTDNACSSGATAVRVNEVDQQNELDDSRKVSLMRFKINIPIDRGGSCTITLQNNKNGHQIPITVTNHR